ncbi:MAG: helix-turn-helix transcriptional regulator [Hyphomonadaceae bacterium]
MSRIVAIGLAAVALLSIPLVLEFATGREQLDAAGIAIEFSEMLVFAATIVAVALLTQEVRDMRRDQDSLVRDLSEARAENAKWREDAKTQLDGVRHAIDAQFTAWNFTPAEKDIAGLLLKGCSHKEIAELRGSNATTVRQQAQAIYRKSGLEGRSEFAAYFLDAILQ